MKNFYGITGNIAIKENMRESKGLTGYPSIDKPWIRYSSELFI